MIQCIIYLFNFFPRSITLYFQFSLYLDEAGSPALQLSLTRAKQIFGGRYSQCCCIPFISNLKQSCSLIGPDTSHFLPLYSHLQLKV